MIPPPPPHLMKRATGNADPMTFTETGRRLARDLVRAAGRHGDWPSAVVLDWGCGPGRVARHLVGMRPDWTLVGADIDGEAAQWCNENIGAACYAQCEPEPPLPTPDEQFDIVLAMSVMTHLAGPMQLTWLAEIRRVLRPGGIFLASVHGETAAKILMPLHPGLLRAGIFDTEDSSYHNIAPPGYYRFTVQSQDWTREKWGGELEIAEYREAGLEHHDLVVCRKQ